MDSKIKQSWNNATWSGSRRAMIKQSLKLSVRERLQALEELCKTSQKLASLNKIRESAK
jgi:O-succinylbenzoate synthase